MTITRDQGPAVDQPPFDATALADANATAALLRCWLREGGQARRVGDVLVFELDASGTQLVAPVRFWSECGWHGFGPVRLGAGAPADATTVAALLSVEAAAAQGARPDAIGDLVERVIDSTRRIADHLGLRGAEPADAVAATPFLEAEQALVLGHPLHPTPKSRSGLSAAEARAYSPELRGEFAAFWFAAHPDVVVGDSATGQPIEELLRDLASDLDVLAGVVPIPAHPWQAADVLQRPAVRALVDQGLLVPLGQAGAPWSPTSSVRTVYRADSPYMLKMSLGLPITNSKRENLCKELVRGVEMSRMLGAGIADLIAAAHPQFKIVDDPAWVTVKAPGVSESGLELSIRANPFGVDDRVQCLAGLAAERPERPDGSLLARLVNGIAERTGRCVGDVGAEWFARYLEAVPAAVIWLWAEQGIGLEAHQQNTLVEVDEEGWPVGGRYRDNQGFYFDDSRTEELNRWAPDAGAVSQALNPRALIDERLGYYLGINNVLGLIGAMASQGLADEVTLLRAFRSLLERAAAELSPVPDVVRNLLEQETLPCKANLLTRLAGMDELVGSVATQSVYRPVPNPVAAVAR